MIKVGDQFLSEALVEAGLARLKGLRPDPPGAVSYRTYTTRLMGLEKAAKKDGVGGWGNNTSASTKLTPPDMAKALIGQSTLLFSIKPPHPPLGRVNKGQTVTVLADAPAGRVKIHFTTSNGKSYEGLIEKSAIQR